MKEILKKVVLGVLNLLARIRIHRLRPFIIGITGSIGKTSTKEAMYTVLNKKYRVLKSEKSYNTEFGLPLAILGQDSGFSSSLKWAKVLLGSVWSAFVGGRDLQIFIVEMGVDKPGDMSYLLRTVRPQIGVMTNIKSVHLGDGQFKDLEDIFNEKKKLALSLPEKGTAILNLDDPYICTLVDKLKCRVLTFGTRDGADLQAFDISQSMQGVEFSVKYKEEAMRMRIPVIGAFHVYVFLPAIASALVQGYTLGEALEGLADFKLPPGRMNLLEGIKGSLIIDSSYNASPEAVKRALDVLADCGQRRIAVLGNMNELGEYSEMKHREVGAYVNGKTDFLITVGDNADWIKKEAVLSGFPEENTVNFQDGETAAEHVVKMIEEGDVILVKGSQNRIRLEKLVKRIMKNPEKASELLVRQDEQWSLIK